ncbi:UNVERIFIED_CONTAM: hypothetical protein K2H54_066754 [Gekko kuhli]
MAPEQASSQGRISHESASMRTGSSQYRGATMFFPRLCKCFGVVYADKWNFFGGGHNHSIFLGGGQLYRIAAAVSRRLCMVPVFRNVLLKKGASLSAQGFQCVYFDDRQHSFGKKA